MTTPRPDPLTPKERALLWRLRRPEAVQRFLDELTYNKEPEGETCRSPRLVLHDRAAHCFEGTLLAACAFRIAGRAPLVLTLRAERDDDHLLALFREKGDRGAWGAVAKSNYAGLRFREPVYRTLRELAMSYFDHYYNVRAEKSLRAMTRPVDLSRFDPRGWETAKEDLWDVSEYLGSRPVVPLVSASQVRMLSLVDPRLEKAGLYGAVAAPAVSHRRAAH
jgi:hypothetical protein